MKCSRNYHLFAVLLATALVLIAAASAEPDAANVTVQHLESPNQTAGAEMTPAGENTTTTTFNSTALPAEASGTENLTYETGPAQYRAMTTPVKTVSVSTIVPPEAKNYDHYVSFTMNANSLAPNYAYDLVTRGEPGNHPWVYNIYMFGKSSDRQDGRVAVYGVSSVSHTQTLISPVSQPLAPGQDYAIVWRYTNINGGELFINGVSQGGATGSGGLDTSLSSSIHIGENMLPSPPPPARPHSAFDGSITEFYHYEKDLELEDYTYSITQVGNPGLAR